MSPQAIKTLCFNRSATSRLPQTQVIVGSVSVEPHGEHGLFSWGTRVVIVPLEAEFSPPAQVTVPRHIGTALWLREIPSDFLSKPCHVVV